MEVALTHQHDAGRKRRHYGADDFRPRLLKRLCHHTDAEFERGGAFDRYLEAVVRKVDVVRRLALPDRQNDVDRLGKNLVAVFIEQVERFGVGGQRAGAYAEDEAALRQMVEHRRIGGDHDRMHLATGWRCR